MTENEWDNETGHAQGMLYKLWKRNHQRTKAGKRKLRLFACACCRAAWPRLPDAQLGAAVEAAERFAEGIGTKEEMQAARDRVEWMRADGALPAKTTLQARVAVDMAVASTDAQAFSAAFTMSATQAPLGGLRGGEAALCALVRCVFGNPFRPVAVASAWRNPDVIALAQAAYDERLLPSGELDKTRLAILADALEEAGASGELSDHLRSRKPHVRGCWVIDHLLRKS